MISKTSMSCFLLTLTKTVKHDYNQVCNLQHVVATFVWKLLLVFYHYLLWFVHISAVHFVSTLGGRGFPASVIDHPKYNLGSMLLGYTPDFVMLNDPQMVSDLDGTWMVLGWFMAVYDVPHHVYSDCFNCFHECAFWTVIIYQPFFSEECIPMFVGWNVLLLVIVCIILGFLNFCLWNSQCFF